nr:immunoglobulin light chain junction region [Macaca mulatta]MOV83787.1 immunoglobulin light chain junction region [Macaca mulatta]
CQQYDNDPYNF